MFKPVPALTGKHWFTIEQYSLKNHIIINFLYLLLRNFFAVHLLKATTVCQILD